MPATAAPVHASKATPALQVNQLVFSYSGQPIKALDHVHLSIDHGELLILLGPNGAGKTSLFSLICGLFAPTHGDILINGQSLRAGYSALSPLGIVFQSRTLDPDLSVEQNLRYFCMLHGIAPSLAKTRIAQGLARMDLQHRADDKVRTLNGGHQRRVEIIRATLHSPSILLLDEPTVGLDIPTRAELIEYIRTLPGENECAILWATHLVDEIRPSDRLAMLHKGRIYRDGTAQSLLEEHACSDLPQLMQRMMQEPDHA